ncbi:glucose dehydrogenase [FAD, quinone]-like [Phlebotomus argentipes]|uniref:glucose dehydrogenase [FAD, quinone]-like n=1 Tax=Phlebotomus argentipes TaxID=94469 RepID=UPI0028936560|nr:glucose dehydrogenase [FAD, quinone]-like [Phlebotomus argentipes]
MDKFPSTCPHLSTGPANQIISLLINYLALSQCSLSAPDTWPRDYGEIALHKGFEEYDFIIVGAGSAGSVVANRLSENPNWKILLLEAGGDPPFESMVPGLQSGMARTEYDWMFSVETINRSIHSGFWQRGKMLGGSSSLNVMIYCRGNADDYDNWKRLGNPTWEFENVLEYFKKSEENHDPEIADAFGGFYHSKDGLMSVELFRSNLTINNVIIQAAQELGYKFILDINANEHIGFTFSQGTIRSGVRESTAAAFLRPAMNRPNLHIVKHAHVTKLEIDSQGVVSGVSMKLRGQTELKAFARKEVILSAGAINSPQILMFSGIGPASHLQEMEIPVIQSLQVGKNLQDHPCIPFLVKLNESNATKFSPIDLMSSYSTYLTEQRGDFATVGSFETIGYVNVDDPLSKYPNFQYYQLFVHKGDIDTISGGLRGFGFGEDVINFGRKEIQTSNIFFVLLMHLSPESKGKIQLRSTNPDIKPEIIPNFLAESSDLASFINAVRLYNKLLSTKTYRLNEATLRTFPIPECDRLKFNSNKYWECYFQYTVRTVFHPVGTVKMGPNSDPDAVVDHTLRVKGVKGLRVIDASIMPRIPRGNTNAPTIMIGEKGADFIKLDWKF